MNVVDSCGWLEYFADGPNAEIFSSPLEAGSDLLIVPTLCLYEVYKTILGQFGRQEAGARIAVMKQSIIVALDDTLALEAAVVSRENKLPMADSIILATARAYNAVLWTQDAHFEHIDGVHYYPKTC